MMNQSALAHKNTPDPVTIAEQFTQELADRADECEKHRVFPQDLAKRMAQAGLYRLCTPAVYGGLERSPLDYARVVEKLAGADASGAWVVFIGITSVLTLASLEPAVARKMLADPATIVAGVFAPGGKAVPATHDGVEGFRLTGRWQWGSGSQNADWVTGGGFVVDHEGKPVKDSKGRPDQRSFVLPAKDIQFLDTWHVSGLQGTGSTDFQVQDLFVPDAHTFRIFGQEKPDYPVFAFPAFGFLGIGLGAVALGIAQAAIDTLTELAGKKTPQGASKPLALKAGTHHAVAEAQALVRSARLFYYNTIETAQAHAEAHGTVTLEHRRDVRLSTTHAVKASAKAVDLMYTLGGGTSVYKTSLLQRHFRDIHVVTQHMMVSDATLELTGRLFIGVETDTTML